LECCRLSRLEASPNLPLFETITIRQTATGSLGDF
jgi:hypothetical protein